MKIIITKIMQTLTTHPSRSRIPSMEILKIFRVGQWRM